MWLDNTCACSVRAVTAAASWAKAFSAGAELQLAEEVTQQRSAGANCNSASITPCAQNSAVHCLTLSSQTAALHLMLLQASGKQGLARTATAGPLLAAAAAGMTAAMAAAAAGPAATAQTAAVEQQPALLIRTLRAGALAQHQQHCLLQQLRQQQQQLGHSSITTAMIAEQHKPLQHKAKQATVMMLPLSNHTKKPSVYPSSSSSSIAFQHLALLSVRKAAGSMLHLAGQAAPASADQGCNHPVVTHQRRAP
jgi:hypothetical protein